MNKIVAPVIGAVLAVTFMACQQSPNQLQTTTSKAVGTLELTFDSLTNKATALVHAGTQTRAVQTNANVTFGKPNTLGVLTDTGNNVQYINAAFNVNNLVASNLTDLTLIAYQKTGNMGGTALKDVYNFAGSSLYASNDPAGIAFAQAVKPVNPPNSVAPFVVNNAGSDLQLFTESELTSLQTAANTASELSTAGGEYLLPYGFVARNSATSRILNASTNNAGTVNVAIQVPTSNSSGANTGYRFSMTFVIFDAPVTTRVSESLQEQSSSSGAATRATNFATNQLAVLAGSAPTTTKDIVNTCRVRTAGTAASPNAYLVAAPSTTTGTLDQCFGAAGIKNIEANAVLTDVNDMLVQADGKIVLVGYKATSTLSNTYDWMIVRLNTDGSLDRSFGASNNGVVVINFAMGNLSDRATTVVQQANGKLMVGGWADGVADRDMALARLNTDGSLDTTFDSDGLWTTDPGGSDRIEQLALQTISTQTYLVVAGRAALTGTAGSQAQVFRFNITDDATTDFLDTSFNNNTGSITFGWNAADNSGTEIISGLAIDSSNKIVLAGYNTNANRPGIARLTTSGAFDTSFDSDGLYFNTTLAVNFYDMVLQNDKVILVGNRFSYEFYAVRFNTATPGLDSSFATNGEFVYNFNSTGNAFARKVMIDSSGRIVLAGFNAPNGENALIVRLSANGVGDSSFSTSPANGIRNVIVSASTNDNASGLAFDSDGKIVVGGYKVTAASDNDWFAFRMNP